MKTIYYISAIVIIILSMIVMDTMVDTSNDTTNDKEGFYSSRYSYGGRRSMAHNWYPSYDYVDYGDYDLYYNPWYSHFVPSRWIY